MTPEEQDTVLATVQKLYAATKHLDREKAKEQHQIDSIFDTCLGVNNFEYLSKLEQLYFNRHADALTLYPYIRKHFSLDGDGTHAMDT